MSVEDQIVLLQQTIAQQTAAVDSLTEEVVDKIDQIDQRMSVAEAQIQQQLQQARLEYPIYRITRNQYGLIQNGLLDQFSTNGSFTINFELYRTIYGWTNWDDLDSEAKEILAAMGQQHKTGPYTNPFLPPIYPALNVIRMTWSGWNDTLDSYTFYQPFCTSHKCTSGCYARLISGQIDGHAFTGITNEWGVCGRQYEASVADYELGWPRVLTPSGEVLFIWYATVAGHVPLDRDNPKWGFYPHIDSEYSMDINK